MEFLPRHVTKRLNICKRCEILYSGDVGVAYGQMCYLVGLYTSSMSSLIPKKKKKKIHTYR